MLQELTDQIQNITVQTQEIQRKQAIAHLAKTGKEIVAAEVAKLNEFNPEQKQILIEKIDPRNFFERIEDVYDTEAVSVVLKSAVQQTAKALDETIRASLPVPARNLFDHSRGTDTANLKNLHEHAPPQDRSLYEKVSESVMDRLKLQLPTDAWVMPESHENFKHIKTLMDRFYAKHRDRLMQETTQANIGGRIATIAAMMIPLAFRITSAFQVVDMKPAERRIVDVKIKRWDPTPVDEDVVTSYANLDPGEGDGTGTGGVINTSNLSYLNFPIYVTRQALRSRLTPEAIATSMGTPMDPLMDTVEGLALDVMNRIDKSLWYHFIVGGMNQDKGQVTSNETFTQVSSTNLWRSANRGWIPYAWVKTVDGEGNPTKAAWESLAPASGASAAPTGLGTQGISLTASHASGTDAALLFGTDYTIDYVNGEITLTAAGETKRGNVHSAAAVVGTYSYTHNINTWSQSTPNGITMVEHLISLRRAIGKAKVAVTDRNWMPNFLGVSYDLEDRISQGDRMTLLGGTPADALDRLNQVLVHAGLETVRTSAIGNDYAIVGQKGSVCHAVLLPWMFGPEILTDWRTGERYILGESWTASDTPVKDMISLVGITS